jgi:uncharacterized Zn finger protein
MVGHPFILTMYIEAYCPECKEIAEHEVLDESHDLLVRCEQCNQVHRSPRRNTPPQISIKTIVSADQISRICQVEMGADEDCRIGDHLVAECTDECTAVEVTGIEAGPRRLSHAKAREISALWTRVIEAVVVRISVHEGWETIPLMLQCRGEDTFIVGETYVVGKKRFRITHIKMRDGAVLRKEGWKTVAQKIKRIYGKSL